MQHHNRNPIRIAALLDIHTVPVFNIQNLLIIWINRRIEKL